MTQTYHQFHHPKAILGYQKAGIGSQILLVFHGFGQDHSAFNSLVGALGERFTFYSFDLFFHGKSKWLLDDKPLDKEYWADLLNAFLAENKIKRFSLMGFSLGGKFALASLEVKASQVDSVYLIAPDGIKTNIWYKLATYPVLLRPLFKSMILHPGRFNRLVKLLESLGVMDKGVIRFAQSQMDTEEKRRKVYNSWVIFRPLKFSMNNIAGLINSNSIKLLVILGQCDKIITEKGIKRLLSRITNYKLEIVNTGHTGLIDKSIEVLKAAPELGDSTE